MANISEVNDDTEVLKGDIDIKGMSNQEIMLNTNSYSGHLLNLITFIDESL